MIKNLNLVWQETKETKETIRKTQAKTYLCWVSWTWSVFGKDVFFFLSVRVGLTGMWSSLKTHCSFSETPAREVMTRLRSRVGVIRPSLGFVCCSGEGSVKGFQGCFLVLSFLLWRWWSFKYLCFLSVYTVLKS